MKKQKEATFNPQVIAELAASSPTAAAVSRAIDLTIVAVFLVQAAAYREEATNVLIDESGLGQLPGSQHGQLLKKLKLLEHFEGMMNRGVSFADALALTKEKAIGAGFLVCDFAGWK